MLTAAFIGFGNSVVNYHLPYLAHSQHVNVKRIFRREEDRIGDTERELDYPELQFTTHLNDVLHDPDIQLIVVCTYVDSHVEYARLALEHGKHVLVEKPFAATPQEAQQIFDLAKQRGLIAMANQNRRFDGDFLTLKQVLDSGKLGQLVELQSHYHYFMPDRIQPGFMMLHGLAVHTIDQLYSLFGQPEHIHYDVRSARFPGESDDYIDIDFHYGHFKATVKCSLTARLDYPKFIVHGDRGSFIKYSSGHQSQSSKQPGRTLVQLEQESEHNWGKLAWIDEQGQPQEQLVPSEITDYSLLYEQLYRAIVHGEAKPVQDEEVISVLRILEQGVEAAKQHVPTR